MTEAAERAHRVLCKQGFECVQSPQGHTRLLQLQKSDCGEQGRVQAEGGGGKQSCLQECWGPGDCPSLGSGGKGRINDGHSHQAELSSPTQKKAFLTIRT